MPSLVVFGYNLYIFEDTRACLVCQAVGVNLQDHLLFLVDVDLEFGRLLDAARVLELKEAEFERVTFVDIVAL